MDKIAEAYPLAWPVGWPRTPAGARKRSKFTSGRDHVSIAAALGRLRDQVRMIRATDLVVSSNIPIRRDGLPYAKVSDPKDPGIAIYLRLRAGPYVFPCDKWDRVAGNIAAVAAHLEALRGQERWGVGTREQAFAGYRALAAVGERAPWWAVLGFREAPPLFSLVKAAWLERIERCHPDKGGNANQAAELNAAFQEARLHFEVGADV